MVSISRGGTFVGVCHLLMELFKVAILMTMLHRYPLLKIEDNLSDLIPIFRFGILHNLSFGILTPQLDFPFQYDLKFD